MLKKITAHFYFVFIGFLITLDQVTKYYALKYLSFDKTRELFEFYNVTFGLVLAKNQGVSFSMFWTHGDSQRYLSLFIFSVLFIFTYIATKYLIENRKDITDSQLFFIKIAISCVVAGALGNIVDRIYHGGVIDFIDIAYKHWHWPTFNIADILIAVGFIIIVLWETWNETTAS